MKARVTRVFSFIVALTLVFAMVSTPAYADFRQMGAWMLSALTALNITWNSTVAPVLQGMDYLEDPFQITDTGIFEYVPYTYDAIDDILDQSTVSFAGNEIIIDGKHYQNIWLSHDAAEKFRVNAFDIKTAFDIASESVGTYVSGAGSFDGVPIFTNDSSSVPYVSQHYLIPSIPLPTEEGQVTGTFVGLGNIASEITQTYGNTRNYSLGVSAGLSNGISRSFSRSYTYTNPRILKYIQVHITDNNTAKVNFYADILSFSAEFFSNEITGLLDLTPFDFDWVAGEVPPDSVLPVEHGLNLYVPTDPDEWEDDPNTQDIINNYNDYITNNPEFSPGLDIDLDDESGILDKLGDLIKIISSLLNIMPDPQFGPKGEEPEPPEPPVPPVPTGTIADEPWSSLRDILNNILQWLENIYDGILDIPTSIVNAITSLQNIVSQIKSVLDNILSQLSDFVNKLLNHDVDWFDDVVDAIRQPFMRWFGILKAGVGIWHYVVEWLQYITTPFTFFFGILNSLGGIFVSPFYAVAAACIVIAIYRRFGR